MERVVSDRTAATHAAYLLPHLKPGMRMLDIGCGPGSISVGLAKAVNPGEFHGVDMEESQVQLATKAVQEAGHSNASFQVADALNLPFPDDYFDAVHTHAVLTHVPDTMAALAEIKRVLKSGGIVGMREFIADSSFIAPDIGNLTRIFAIWAAVVVTNGGHPQFGREQGARLNEAGFVDIARTASFDSYASAEAIAAQTGFFAALPFEGQAISYGVVTPEEIDELRKAALVWRDQPGALSAWAFGEAIAHKP
jgi:ubiquinone/menaquinone biosynthesis C-methylase UbiE